MHLDPKGMIGYNSDATISHITCFFSARVRIFLSSSNTLQITTVRTEIIGHGTKTSRISPLD